MNLNAYEIKDNCRRNLAKYTLQAFSVIPKLENPLILDMGCGTGVPTLALLEVCYGNIYAVDADKASLLWLEEKVKALNYSDRIKIIHASVFDRKLFDKKFDIVLAEGLLNVIGFEEGLPSLLEKIKSNGYLIIHDELKNDLAKQTMFKEFGLDLLNSFELDDNIWWDDYYSYIDKAIKLNDNKPSFQKEINEIAEFKKNSKLFKSIYYVLQKR